MAACSLLTPRRFTIDEYHALTEVGAVGPREGVELLDGLVYLKSGSSAAPHIRVTLAPRDSSDGKPSESLFDVKFLPATAAATHAAAHLRRFTAEDFEAICRSDIFAPDEHVELLDGHVVTMSPSGSRHSSVVTRLARLLIKAAPEHLDVRVQEPLIAGGFSQPQPDLAVVPRVKSRHWGGHPQAAASFLIIEVADTTLEADRLIKAPLYLAAGVPEYWVVDVEGRRVLVFDGEGERESAEKLSHAAFPGLEIGVAELFGD